ncbi:MAG: ABC transporter ATP-binding protein [Spirochaetes bacterium]|nr:ABC transporter ATP-binding protein [Spirochaetota bacterium]
MEHTSRALPKIRASHISKVFSNGKERVEALRDFSLEVQEGEFLCIVGPSGCGKSSFLRILAGLLPASSGTIEIQPGEDPGKPLTSMVFQEYAVFPWKTVLENVGFGLQMRGVPKAERLTIAQSWIERVGLSKFIHAYPHQLSGGMKQRVGIARALASDPEILLMDEPLGALDAQTRTLLQEEILRIWEERRKTVVYVTHSIEEAVLLGDRVVLMTAHPGTQKAVFPIPLPRPRDLKVMATAEFGELTYTIWEALRGEVLKAMKLLGET